MKRKIGILVVAAAVIAGWIFLSDIKRNSVDVPQSAAPESAQESQHPFGQVAVRDDIDATTVLSGRLGGPAINLRESLIEISAKEGANSQAFGGMLTLAVGACSSDLLANEKARKSPQKAWAIQYIEMACKGFNPDEFKFTGTDRGLLAAELEKGPEAAILQASQEIRRTDNTVTVVLAGLYLIENGHLPNREVFDLNDEQLAKSLGFAAGLRTCVSMNACGSQSLLTAQICANNGCPPGSTYAQAMRNILSPKEYAAGLKLRDQLAAM